MLPHTQVQRRRRRYIRPRYTYDFILPSSLKMQLAWFHTCHATTLSLRMNLISSKHIPQSQIASTQMPNHPIEEDLTKRKPTRAKLGQQRDHRPTEENLSKKKKRVPICKSQSLDLLLLLYLSIWAAKMELTGMKPANCWACCMCPRRKVSLEMGLEQALQCERDELAYSAFHGFGSPAATTAAASAGMVVLSSSPIFSSTNCSQPNSKLLKIVQNPIESYSKCSKPNWKLLKILHNPIENCYWDYWRDGVRAWRRVWERMGFVLGMKVVLYCDCFGVCGMSFWVWWEWVSIVIVWVGGWVGGRGVRERWRSMWIIGDLKQQVAGFRWQLL